ERPNINISWLADHPATLVLKDHGENLLPEAALLTHGNKKLEDSAKDYQNNLVRWVMNMRKAWSKNAEIFAKIAENECFDLVIGDETYDLTIGIVENPKLKKFPFAMIYDFIGLDSVTWNPIDKLVAYMTNRLWVKILTKDPPVADHFVFLGEFEDVQDRKFGFMLPNRRWIAKKYLDFVGYVLSFDPRHYEDKAKVRRNLGYGKEPLIVCSIGGTAGGKPLLDLCLKAYPIIKKELKDLRMVLVCGPRLSPTNIEAPDGVEVKGYVPELYRHLAASDLCIVTGGGTITLELTALQRPFLYFPLEKHFEQEIEVVRRCERHNAGVKMKYSKTKPESLAKHALLNIGKRVDFASIPIDGAQKAAKLISNLL
ncbi:MAG: hypothetical protein JSV20_02380, partial [Candidatus Bathyarchaeota archaeon]